MEGIQQSVCRTRGAVMKTTNTSIFSVLESFRDGQPHTQLDIEEATGIKAGVVWTYIDRLKAKGEIERVTCGCRCVKHKITFLGVARLESEKAVQQQEAEQAVIAARKVPNSVFALGGM